MSARVIIRLSLVALIAAACTPDALKTAGTTPTPKKSSKPKAKPTPSPSASASASTTPPSASPSATPTPTPSPSASASASPSPSPSASIAIPAGPEDYFPMRTGAKWVYGLKHKTFGLSVGTMTNRMGTITLADTTPTGKMASVIKTTIPAPATRVEFSLYKRTAAEILRTVGASGSPATFMKLPLAVGTTWEADGFTFKVEAKEDVTVPAGTIKDALKISSKKDTSTDFFWYASQVGLVKFEASIQDQGVEGVMQEYVASGTEPLPEAAASEAETATDAESATEAETATN